MRSRVICEVEEPSGKLPVSRWFEKHLDKKELAALHSKLTRIETDKVLPKEFLKPYGATKGSEIKFNHKGRAIRILCKERGGQVIMLGADAKNDQIDPTVEAQAIARWNAIEKGTANVRSYPLPGRPRVDLDSFR